MGRPLFLRLATVVVASQAPATIGLIALSINGKIAPAWAGLTIAGGLVCGTIAAAALNHMMTARAERLEAMASALEHRQLPSHLLPDERDAMNRAERRLLEAADTVVTTIGSLDRQREEFEAILRGMIEAVVVTGVRGEVVMMNGAAPGMMTRKKIVCGGVPMFCAVQTNSLLTDSTAWREAMNTGKKQEKAMMAILDA